MLIRLTRNHIKKHRLLWFILCLLFLSLLSCVSINEKNLALTNNTATPVFSSELLSCQHMPVIPQSLNNTQGINPDNIAFLNWNLYKGNGENWQQDLSAFAKSHQVMTIQEAMLDEELTMLLEDHEFNWVMNTAFHLNGEAAGVMNAASSDAVHSCGFKTKEPIIRIPKSTLVSYYRINGTVQKLLVANIHGINFTLGTDSYREQLQMLYQAIRYHDGPMIVAGDFNSWSNSRMAEVDTLIELLSLSKLEYSVNNKTHVFGNAIDHVFYRGLEIVTHQVKQVSSSDHNPISVNFRYRLL